MKKQKKQSHRCQCAALQSFIAKRAMSASEQKYFVQMALKVKLPELEESRQVIILNWLWLSLCIRREMPKLFGNKGDLKLFNSLISTHTSLSKSLGFLPKDTEDKMQEDDLLNQFIRTDQTE